MVIFVQKHLLLKAGAEEIYKCFEGHDSGNRKSKVEN